MQTSIITKRTLWIVRALTFFVALTCFAPVSAQPTQALTEFWHETDFNFNGQMMDMRGNYVYVLGDNPATNILNIRKYTAKWSPLNPTGFLQWQTTYNDPVYNLSGVWIAADSNGDSIVLANIIRSTDGQTNGLMTLKYDTNGNLLWVNSLPGIISGAVRVDVDLATIFMLPGSLSTIRC